MLYQGEHHVGTCRPWPPARQYDRQCLNIVVVTAFISILNQMEFNFIQNQKENCHHDHIPFNYQGEHQVHAGHGPQLVGHVGELSIDEARPQPRDVGLHAVQVGVQPPKQGVGRGFLQQ